MDSSPLKKELFARDHVHLMSLRRTAGPSFAKICDADPKIEAPEKKAFLQIPCPLKTCLGSEKDRPWYCHDCHQQLTYDIKGYCYCNCGRSSISGLTFKCNDAIKHPDFIRCDIDELKQIEMDICALLTEENVLPGATQTKPVAKERMKIRKEFDEAVGTENAVQLAHDSTSVIPSSKTEIVATDHGTLRINTSRVKNEAEEHCADKTRPKPSEFKDGQKRNETEIKISFAETNRSEKEHASQHSERGMVLTQAVKEKPPARLVQLAPLEFNVLVLGQTGVGKTTWINSLVNYLAAPDFNDALQKNKPIVLTRARFTVNDLETYEPTTYILEATKSAINRSPNGDFVDENIAIGESATRQARAYCFMFGRVKIRLIDTPGIGDSQGADFDKTHFEETLALLSHYNTLHGICILLKPNESVITVEFRYCIKELLTRLHRSAANNIVSASPTLAPSNTNPVIRCNC